MRPIRCRMIDMYLHFELAFRVSFRVHPCNPAEGRPTERSGGYMSALDGLVVTGMVFKHALGECVRIRSESKQFVCLRLLYSRAAYISLVGNTTA